MEPLNLINGCHTFSNCAIEKVFKNNHENTKGRKHKKKDKNQFNILRANF